MDYVTVLGVFGAGIILVGFLLNQAGKLTADSWRYDAINVIGSVLLLVYSVLLGSVPFVILNVVWLVVSVKGLAQSRGV